MEQELKVPIKSINDFKISLIPWKCEKCNTLLQYPSNQRSGLMCPFCKIPLIQCSPNDPLMIKHNQPIDENKPHEKIFLLLKRDSKGKIIDVKEVDKEKFDSVATPSSTNIIDSSLEIPSAQDKWATKLSLDTIHPFISEDDDPVSMDVGFKIVIYKQGDYCGITKILNEMITSSISNFYEMVNKDVKFELIITKAEKRSFTSKNLSIYPQIAVFYHGTNSDYFINHIPIKDLNEESFLNQMIYWDVRLKRGIE